MTPRDVRRVIGDIMKEHLYQAARESDIREVPIEETASFAVMVWGLEDLVMRGYQRRDDKQGVS